MTDKIYKSHLDNRDYCSKIGFKYYKPEMREIKNLA